MVCAPSGAYLLSAVRVGITFQSLCLSARDQIVDIRKSPPIVVRKHVGDVPRRRIDSLIVDTLGYDTRPL